MRPIEEVELNVVECYADVEAFFRWLGERRDWLAWDTETGGLEFYREPLRLFQFGDTETGWCFRWDRWAGVCEEVFRNYEGNFTGQNVGFDVRFVEHHSNYEIRIPWARNYDTKIMAHILDPTKSTSLKALGARFLSPTAKKLQGALAAAMKQQGWTWRDIPYDFEIYTGYAALDTILTARIATEFWPKIEAQYKAVFELESDAARICSNMEVKGTMVDVQYCKEKYREILEFCAQSEQWCLDNYGIKPGQNQEVALALVRDGVDLSKTTASGDLAMDKDVLEGIDHPLAQTVLAHRKSTKIGSSYFRNFLEMNDNGVLHPSINTLGARTGRMSITNPAAQTLPRGRVVRDAFIPRPGHQWLCVDFSNIEMKLMAHFAYLANREASLGFWEAAKSQDMHLTMARMGYQDDTIQKSDPRRQVFKNANFAKAFVAGVEKFAWTAGIPIDEAAKFLDEYDRMFPGVRILQNQVIDTVKRRQSTEGIGYITRPLGRRHPAEPKKEYTAMNYLVQGTAAEAFKSALVDLDNAGFGPYMLLPVHDEQNFEIPNEHAEDMQYEIQACMVRNGYSLPLTVEGSLGENWGAAK